MAARVFRGGADEPPCQAAFQVLIDGENGLSLRAIALDHDLERLEAGEGGLNGGRADAFFERLLLQPGEKL
jgi:hypothetical protein